MPIPLTLSTLLASQDADAQHLFLDVLVIFATAAAVATVFRKLKFETIPGYLVAGTIRWPARRLRLVSDIKTVEQISAPLAIILLMFGIGLILETASAKRGMLSIFAVGAVSHDRLRAHNLAGWIASSAQPRRWRSWWRWRSRCLPQRSSCGCSSSGASCGRCRDGSASACRSFRT